MVSTVKIFFKNYKENWKSTSWDNLQKVALQETLGSLGIRKMISDRICNLQKGINTTRSGNYWNKCEILFSSFVITLKIN